MSMWYIKVPFSSWFYCLRYLLLITSHCWSFSGAEITRVSNKKSQIKESRSPQRSEGHCQMWEEWLLFSRYIFQTLLSSLLPGSRGFHPSFPYNTDVSWAWLKIFCFSNKKNSSFSPEVRQKNSRKWHFFSSLICTVNTFLLHPSRLHMCVLFWTCQSTFIYFICGGRGGHMCHGMCLGGAVRVSEDNLQESFSVSTIWVPGIKLWLSVLATSTITPRAVSPALEVPMITCINSEQIHEYSCLQGSCFLPRDIRGTSK